jgi:hypothetical protein
LLVACCFLVAADLALSWLVKNKLESVENHQQVIIKNDVAHVAELLFALVFQLLPLASVCQSLFLNWPSVVHPSLFFFSVKY